MIQTTIRRKFADCTVLTIAHRINTIIDSDRVLVMDRGTVSEFDHPYKLLEDENSIFYDMVKELEKETMEQLKTAAKENYENRLKDRK